MTYPIYRVVQPPGVIRWPSLGTTSTPSTATHARFVRWDVWTPQTKVIRWDSRGTVGGTPAPSDVIRNFSLREWRQWRKPEDEAELQRRGLEQISAEVIDDVASRQAGDPRQDDQQRLEELRGELRLKGLEMRSAHIEALNEHREALIREELRAWFQKRQNDENAALLLILAACA